MVRRKRKTSPDSDIKFGPSKPRRKRHQQESKQSASRLLNPRFLECSDEEDAFDNPDAIDRPLTRSFMNDLCKSDNTVATPSKILSNSNENGSLSTFQRSTLPFLTPLSTPVSKSEKQKQPSSDIHPTQILEVTDEHLSRPSTSHASSIELDTVPVLKTPINPPQRRDLNPNKRRNNSPIASNKRPRTINFKNNEPYSTTDHQQIFLSSQNGNETIENEVDTSSSSNFTIRQLHGQALLLISQFSSSGQSRIADGIAKVLFENAHVFDETIESDKLSETIKDRSKTIDTENETDYENNVKQSEKYIYGDDVGLSDENDDELVYETKVDCEPDELDVRGIYKHGTTYGCPTNVRIYPGQYEIVESRTYQMIVYSNAEKTEGYTYIYNTKHGHFKCYHCNKHKPQRLLTAKVYKSKMKQQFVVLRKTCHICTPYPVSVIKSQRSIDLQMIKHPEQFFELTTSCNYEYIESRCGNPLLVHYTNPGEGFKYYLTANTMMLRCAQKRCNSRMKQFENADGKTWIQILRISHTHPAEKIEKTITVDTTAFIRDRRTIFVFEDSGSTNGRIYHHNTRSRSYVCYYCQQLGFSRTGKLVLNENGKEIFRMYNQDHHCSIANYATDFKSKQIEIDPSKFRMLQCPKNDDGIADIDVLNTYLSVHGSENLLNKAVCYGATLSGPDTPIEQRYSHVVYIGYSTDLKNRIRRHDKLKKMYKTIYFFPIFLSDGGRCADIEATGIELHKVGSLPFNMANKQSGNWHATELKHVCRNKEHDDHNKIVSAYKRLIYDGLQRTDDILVGNVKNQFDFGPEFQTRISVTETIAEELDNNLSTLHKECVEKMRPVKRYIKRMIDGNKGEKQYDQSLMRVGNYIKSQIRVVPSSSHVLSKYIYMWILLSKLLLEPAATLQSYYKQLISSKKK